MMVSAESRPIEFAPLRGLDADDAEDAFLRGDIEEARLRSRSLTTKEKEYSSRAVRWSIASSIAIYSTKQLMINHGFHYPLAIAFRAFVALSIVYVLALKFGSESTASNPNNISQWGIQKPGGAGALMFNKHCIRMIPAALTAAASVPMLMEGILHMPSLPVLVMVFPVVYAAETLVLCILCSQSPSKRRFPWEAILIFAASSLVLYNEYRLMVPGLLWGLLGLLFTGLSRAFHAFGFEKVGPDIAVQAKLKANHGFVAMTLSFGIVFSGAAGIFFEHIETIYSTSNSTILLMVVNTVSIVLTCLLGASFMAYSPISFAEPKIQFSNIPLQGTELLAAFSSSMTVLLAAVISNPVPVVCWIQLNAYLVSCAALIGIDQIHNSVLQLREITKTKTHENKTPSKIFSGVALFGAIVSTATAIVFLSTSSISSVHQGFPVSLDLSYNPTSRFDIVVSMYEEDPLLVKQTLDTIKTTAMLRKIKPTIIVYTKSPGADLKVLKENTGADVVERMENLGREGGTYLKHIVDKWDKLADQTMFIQAHAHNMRELIPRINDYLVPETGMLSLGFTGVQCECGACGDRWGWEDKFNSIPQLFQKIYKQPCKPEQPILLAYKGQFIASAKRIRGIDRNIYGGLLTAINSKDGWSHNEAIVGDNVDRPDNPYFGFTVERVWGLLLQCGTDESVAAKCPSLLSGMGQGGQPEDCQCLDR
ncbi:hypothetical protein HYALB_00000425 [Hymenoscyphus albidus]|uniref:Uncharacterized protein n=1 Tax=Hymenoscyphus albidus TaxID=595503 RepID=A0A9N9LLR0_9HELO|nr:hypothetical protein HYALB_00000425 [Hymenoscyphus albidus]